MSAPKRKVKSVKFLALNIKLLSNSRKGPNAYEQLLTDLYKSKVVAQVNAGKHAIIRTQFTTLVGESKVIYGKLSKFTKIEGKDWININKLEVEDVEIPADKFPNLSEIDYYFFPHLHRLLIPKSSLVSIQAAQLFFRNGLPSVIGKDEDFDVIVEQSSDIFKTILEAREIKKLQIEISYSNSDILKESAEYMDNQLRLMGAKNFKINVTPDHNGHISMDSEIINGALGVAQSNGEVKAVIVNDNNKKQTISTKQHPNEISVPVESEDTVINAVLNSIKSIFKQ